MQFYKLKLKLWETNWVIWVEFLFGGGGWYVGYQRGNSSIACKKGTDGFYFTVYSVLLLIWSEA